MGHDFGYARVSTDAQDLTAQRDALTGLGWSTKQAQDAVAKVAARPEAEGANTPTVLRLALRELGRKIAMHVAATAPLSLNTDDLDPAAIEKERAVLIEKAKEEGRPEAMIEKIVEGQINKFQKDVVLSKQPFVMDPDVTIEQLVANSAKELGSSNLHLAGFVRLALGEGVEKVEGPDFASEVASMMGGV